MGLVAKKAKDCWDCWEGGVKHHPYELPGGTNPVDIEISDFFLLNCEDKFLLFSVQCVVILYASHRKCIRLDSSSGL